MNIGILCLNLAALALLAFLLWRQGRDRVFWPALACKLGCGIVVGLLYQYYYHTGDTWDFFNEGTRVADALRQNPKLIFDFFWDDQFPVDGPRLFNGRPRSFFFLKWVTALNLLGARNYWIAAVEFSFLSFLASWYLFKILAREFPTLRTEATIAILFIPSTVLWGSGVIKECIAMGCLFLLCGAFVDWYHNRRLSGWHFLLLLLAGWVLWRVKYYWLAVWLAVALPVAGVIVLQQRFMWISRYPKLSWLVLLSFSLAAVSVIHPNFYFHRIFSVIVESHNAFVVISDPEDLIHYYNLNSTAASMLINSPWAFVSACFRPFIFEARTALQVAAAVENLGLLIVFVVGVYRFGKERFPLELTHVALVGYIVLLGVFLALSTPNLGTLSRFRIGFMPFLWFALLSASGVVTKIRQWMAS